MTDPTTQPADDQIDAALGRHVLYVGAYEEGHDEERPAAPAQPTDKLDDEGDSALTAPASSTHYVVDRIVHWRLVMEADEAVNLEVNIGQPTHNTEQPFAFSYTATRYRMAGVPAGFVNSEWVKAELARRDEEQDAGEQQSTATVANATGLVTTTSTTGA